MAVENEVSFPRGNVRSAKRLQRDVSPDNLFGNQFKPPKAKKTKKNNKTKKPLEKNEDISVYNISGTLSYNKVQTGMQILGRIRNIKNLSLEVELPGLTFAKVNITSISDEFTKKMANYLREMQENEGNLDSNNPLKLLFKIGEIIPVKVLNIEHKENGTILESTIHPREINGGRRLDSFPRNMLVWGSIQSELDHGYEINIGLKNCRVFLPFTNVDEGVKYDIGRPIWFVIHKSESSNAATILRVSAKNQHLIQAKVEEMERLDEVTVGMKVDFHIDKVTKTGIHGKFLDKFFGFIDESHLKNSFDTLQNYNHGLVLPAYILYIEPATNITHLTLRNFHTEYKPKFKVGDLVIGRVLSKTSKGIYLSFPNREKGFITNRRLLNSLKKPLSIDVTDIIRIKYPIGGKHKCRILDYSQLLREYICTVEPELVRSDTATANNLTIGQLVKVRVDDVKKEGFVVTCGNIKGFVPNLHMSNSQFTENIKKKFYLGQIVNARVHNIVDENVLFTLKPSYVESNVCLSDPEKAVIGKSYPGMVVNTSQNGALVVFYGDAKGWITARRIKEDPIKYFFYGQMATFCVTNKGPGPDHKLSLSLTTVLTNDERHHLHVGKMDVGIVQSVNENEIRVKLKKENITATVPIYHLSTNVELCPIMAKMYKTGDELGNLMCIRTDPLTYSRRESQALGRGMKLFKFNQLKPGHLIRCSYVYKTKTGIFVYPLLKDYTEKVLIKFKDCDDSVRIYQPHECIPVKVINCNTTTRTLKLSAKLVDVYNSKSEYSVKLFVDQLKDFNDVVAFGEKKNWPICKYKPGQKVDCKVEKIGEQGGCLVKLPNEENGLVVAHLSADNMKAMEVLRGVCLSYDFPSNYIDVCLKKHYFSRINAAQNGKVLNGSLLLMAEKLLVKERFIIAVLHGDGRRQLIYIPLYLHENDTKGSHEYYSESKFKICICATVGSLLVGISKRLFKKLESDYKREMRLYGQAKKSNKNEVNETVTKESSEEEDIVEEELEEEPMEVDIKEELVQEIPVEKPVSIVKKEEKSNVETPVQAVLPGISSFYGGNRNEQGEESSSDDDEEEQEVKKKKKLTPAERAELARQEEERLTRIEKELADSTVQPQSADQFDRLLLANPNSSVLWTRYISFHISLTELEKGRAVGKRALEAIDITLTQERFNIWIALLHLENLYGTTESFGTLFDEAVRCNDSLQVYLKVIEMLAESGKLSEMEEKVKKVRGKHKQNVDMWLELGKVYYLLKNFKEARNMKNIALKSITDKKAQMNLIVRFAIMEFKFGEQEQGAAIFETIISSDPKKVNIWTTYVDQLVKINEIDQARKVLDRAVSQRLPLKSMKSLFMKFRKFEEEHGNEQSVEQVKERAKEYVTKYSK